MPNQIRLLTTGLNGLVGSKFSQIYQSKYQFTNLDLRNLQQPIDITNYQQVLKSFQNSQAQTVIHLAAYTDVTGAWQQRGDKNGLAYQVNVIGTKNIVKACEKTYKNLIHISTSYVFNGQKTDSYVEKDQAQPIEWYGETKYLAEQIVKNSAIKWTILRIDQPFRSDPFPKKDIIHNIIDHLKNNTLYPMFDNHFFGPTYIEDFSKVIDFFIRTKTTGLFHASSGEKWNDYDFAIKIKKILKLPGEVKKGNLDDYLKTLNRPYQKNTAMNCNKLKNILDFKMKSITTAINEFV